MTLQTYLAEPIKRIAILFDIFLDSGDRNLWNGSLPLQVGNTSYLPVGNMVFTSGIIDSLDVNDLQMTGTIESDENELILLARNENFQNRRIKIWLTALDEDFDYLDRDLLIEGVITNIDVDTSPDMKACRIEIRGPTRLFRNTVAVNYTQSDQFRLNPTDTFFKFITASRTNPPQWGAKK